MAAAVDTIGRIDEASEDNNYLSKPYATAAPDIVVSSLTYSPTLPDVGDNVTVSVVVTNRGAGRAEASWLAYFIDEQFIGTFFTNSLSVNATATSTFYWTALSGLHTFGATADYLDDVFESDEDNNQAGASISTALPDLALTSLTQSPASPSLGDKVTFTATMVNNSAVDVGVSRLSYYFDSDSANHQVLPALAAGESVSCNITWWTEPDSHTLWVFADSENVITEADEANNSRSLNIGAPLVPDLKVSSISFAPALPEIGDQVTVTAVIANLGTGNAYSTPVTLFVDSVQEGHTTMHTIGSGSQQSASFTFTAGPGSQAIRVVADAINRIVESDEDNNEREVTVSTHAPDLTITEISCLPERATPGQKVTVSMVVKNQGSLAAPSTLLHYYVDGAGYGSHLIPPLAAGEYTVRAFTWKMTTASHSFSAIIDAENAAAETDETNNELALAYPVPDLAVSGITWTPAAPVGGDTVNLEITVGNDGLGPSGAASVSVFINDELLAEITLPGLAAGASTTQSVAWNAAEGEHSVRAIIDSLEPTYEHESANNEAVAAVTVLPAPETPEPAAEPTLAGAGTGLAENAGFTAELSGVLTEVLVGDTAVIAFSAINPTDGVPRLVELNLVLPEGLSLMSAGFTPSGESGQVTSFELNPGESRELELFVEVTETGLQLVEADIYCHYLEGDAETEYQAATVPITVSGNGAPDAAAQSSILEKAADIVAKFGWYIVGGTLAVAGGALVLLRLRQRKAQVG